MIFLLGAFCAGLLALMLLPAFWRRAMRLSRRRLEMLMPLSIDEVTAERDLLRAEFAAERRKLEQRMEAQAAEQGAEMAELGRRASRIVGLESELSALQAAHATLTSEHAQATRELAETLGERGAMLTEIHDATSLNETMRQRYAALRDQHADAAGLADTRRIAIAGLETKILELEARAENYARDVEAHARKARNEEDRATGLGEERDMLLKEMRAVEQMMSATQARFEAELARSAQLQETLETTRRDADQAMQAQHETQRGLDAAERARAQAEQSAGEAARKLANIAAERHAADNAAADRMEELRAEIAALRGALDAAREARNGRAIGAPDAAQLREAIADIGVKVAQMARSEQPGV